MSAGQVVQAKFLPSPWAVFGDMEVIRQSAAQAVSFATAAAVAAWPSANRAIYVPFWVPVNARVKTMQFFCTTTNSANFDVGIYDAAGNKLISAGSTALAAGINTFTPTNPQLLLAGSLYYAAMGCVSTSSTILRFSVPGTTGGQRVLGVAQQASAVALPATFTLAQAASAYVPVIVLNFVESPA